MAAATAAVAIQSRPKIEAVVAGRQPRRRWWRRSGGGGAKAAAVVQDNGVGESALHAPPWQSAGRASAGLPQSPQFRLESRLYSQPEKSGGTQ